MPDIELVPDRRRRCETRLLFALLTAVAFLCLPVDGAAAGPVDLKLGKLGGPGFASSGGELPFNAAVVRSGSGRVGPTGLRIALTQGSKKSKGAIKLGPLTGVGPLRGRARKAPVAGVVRLPGKIKPGSYGLLGCVDAGKEVRERSERNNCKLAPGKVRVIAGDQPAPSSQDLIEVDLRAGKLTAPQAAAYRVLALFDHPKLPFAYRGHAGGEADHTAPRELADLWPALPAQLQKLVGPLMAPPAQRPQKAKAAGAADAPVQDEEEEEEELDCVVNGYRDHGWKSIPAAGGKILVNWDPEEKGHAEAAREIAGYATQAYSHHLRVMGRPPLSDAAVPCYHGPDGALDIYVRPQIPRAVAVTMPAAMTPVSTPDCDAMPSFILTEPSGTSSLSLRFTIAHELFHAFQNAYVESGGCADHRWFDEASANWAGHGVFPTDQSEHLFDYTLRFPDTDLAIQDYHGWVFALWMQKTLGEGSIRSVYTRGERVGSIKAVDGAIGSWRSKLLDFARHAWNTDPYPSFSDWDSLGQRPVSQNSGPIIEQNLFLAGQKQRKAFVPQGLSPRSRNYRPFAITDPKIKEIVFVNPRPTNPDYRVGAIITLKSGATRFDDWSGRKTVRYCGDNPSEDISKIVVVSANSALNPTFSGGYIEGTGELRLKDSCEEFPWRFEVLGATLKTDTTASKDASGNHICASIAGLPIGGQRVFQASTATPRLDPANVIDKRTDGSLSGTIFTRGTGGWSETIYGCENLEDTPQVCNATNDRPLMGDGTIGIGASVRANSTSAATATLDWAIPSPDVGYFDADESVCYVFEIWKGLDDEHTRQEIPLSQLKSGQPVTISFEGDGQWTSDQRGDPAQIAASWESSLTIRRVDEDGNPLSRAP